LGLLTPAQVTNSLNCFLFINMNHVHNHYSFRRHIMCDANQSYNIKALLLIRVRF